MDDKTQGSWTVIGGIVSIIIGFMAKGLTRWLIILIGAIAVGMGAKRLKQAGVT